MKKNATFLAIIPARGGSKRLLHKNILPLNNRPLISYSIQAGLQCQRISKVLVTSDNLEILNISKELGANVLQRPIHLASDTSSTFDTIKHAIENTQSHDYIVLLQPTSPLRTLKHISQAIELLESKDADAIISVCQVDHSPFWSNTLDASFSMKNFLSDEVQNKRSQDLEIFYRLNGAIYICKTSKLLENKGFMLKENIYAYVMDRKDSIDIDEKYDLDLAELILKNNP